MSRSTTRALTLAVAAGGCAGALLTAAPVGATPPPSPSFTPVLTGLNAPRGITFDSSGAMYLAEAGVAGPGPAGMTRTGRVSKYAWGATTPSWSTTFASVYNTQDPSQPPDVLGPSGVSALGRCGPDEHSRAWHRRHAGEANDCRVVVITGESTPGLLAASHGAVNDPQAGHLFALNPRSGRATSRSDVGSQMYAWTGANASLFPSDFPDSNPYAVLVTRGAHPRHHDGRVRTFVADAGANTILEIGRHGRARIVAYIPNETSAPFRDATPTCIAQGPDGYLYVATLDLLANFAHGDGQSNVWRISPDASYPAVPTKWATGLSTVTSCTFDRAGNFWATEMFAGGPAATPPGDIVKIPFAHPTTQTRIGAGVLAVPGGIAQGPDGAMYVTVGSAAPGPAGAVIRVSGA